MKRCFFLLRLMLMMLQVVKDGAAILDEAGPLQFHIALKVSNLLPDAMRLVKFLLLNMHQESITYHLFLNCSRGGSALGILNNTLMGCMSWYGGCISASSISVMPADQISACQKNTSTTSVYLVHFQYKKQNLLVALI